MSWWDIGPNYYVNKLREEVEAQALEDLDAHYIERQRQTQETGRLMLVVQAMWEIAQDKLGVTEKELMAKIKEIDLRDGAIDDKGGFGPVSCKKCSQEYASFHFNCIYCDEKNHNQGVF